MSSSVTKPNVSGPVVLSYSSDSENLASYVYNYLKKKTTITVWMDKHDANSASFTSSVANSIEKCSGVICFLTPNYQDASSCQRELTYATNLSKPIVPCLIGSSNPFDTSDDNDNDDDDDDDDDTDWCPSDWLGILIADLRPINFSGITKTNVDQKCEELFKRIENIVTKTPTK